MITCCSHANSEINIPDVEEGVFRRFLDYLYGAPLDPSTLPTDTAIDLIYVADR